MRIKDLKSYLVEMGDYWSESAYLTSDLPEERNAETAPPEGEWVVIYYRKPHPRHKETRNKLQVGVYLGIDKKGKQVWMGPILKGSRMVLGRIPPPSRWLEIVW